MNCIYLIKPGLLSPNTPNIWKICLKNRKNRANDGNLPDFKLGSKMNMVQEQTEREKPDNKEKVKGQNSKVKVKNKKGCQNGTDIF